MMRNPFNFRRVMPFRTGPDRIACIFRSASLDNLSVEAATRLHRRIGISTFIDLQHYGSAEPIWGRLALNKVGISRIHVAIRSRARSPQTSEPDSDEYANYYASILEECAASFAVAFCEVAFAAPQGVIFACRQGKDRTGLLAAALQEAAEVSADKILSDFARSGVALVRAASEFQGSWRKRGLTRQEYLRRYYLGAAPLAKLQARLGGYGALLRCIVSAAPTQLKMDNAIQVLRGLRGTRG